MPAYVDKEFGSHSHSKKVLQSAREFRRAQIYQLYIVQRMKETDIARVLECSQGTVSNEINAIKSEAKANLQVWLTEHLPVAHTIAVSGIDAIIAEIWRLLLTNGNNDNMKLVDRTNLLSLLSHVYETRLTMCADGELVSIAMEEMSAVKRQLASMLPSSPGQAACAIR